MFITTILITLTLVLVKGDVFVPRRTRSSGSGIIGSGSNNNKNVRNIKLSSWKVLTNNNNNDDDINAQCQDHDMNSIIMDLPRGGASKAASIDIITDDEEDAASTSFVMKKIRNVIRSTLRMTDKKIPIAAKLMRTVLKCVETVSGMKLLPSTKSEKKKEKRKQRESDNETKKSKSKKTNTNANSIKAKQKAGATGQAKAHLSKDLKMSNPNYRIQRELKEFLKSPPTNLSVKVGKNIRIWIITMVGTKGSLYEGEKYRLRVSFPASYPTEPPSVYFLQPTPRHEHVYTNGDICLSLLGKDWRPNMTAQSIAMSILSILSGAGRKSLPMDNAAHAQHKPGEAQNDWVYHDDNC